MPRLRDGVPQILYFEIICLLFFVSVASFFCVHVVVNADADVCIVVDQSVQFVYFTVGAYFHAFYIGATYAYVGYVLWFKWVHVRGLCELMSSELAPISGQSPCTFGIFCDKNWG